MTDVSTVMITGATSGIGQYLARFNASLGRTVILHGRSEERLRRVAETCNSPNVHAIAADLGAPGEIRDMFESIRGLVNSVDLLVNNAFGKLESSLADSDDSDIEEFYRVALSGTALVTKHALPLLRQAEVSRVINIVADWGFPMHNIMTGPAIYVSGKYGVHGLGAALQMELGEYGIRTTNLCPGIVAADFEFGGSDADFASRYGREAMHPQSIADAIEFVVAQRHCHVRSLVLSPTKGDYDGL